MHEPLTAILGTRAKVAVLRILWRASSPLHYRELVRRSGMAYGSVDLAVSELVATGLVAEVPAGRERRVRLESGHRLAAAIASLLQVESDYFSALRVELRTMAQACTGDGLLSAAVVGSVARREERIGDDLELVFIARDAAGSARCRDRLEVMSEAVTTRFGVRVRLLGYDRPQAVAMWQSRTPAAERAVKEAELLTGVPMADLLAQ